MSHIYMLFFLQEESLYTDYFTKYIIEESLYTDYSTKYIISLLNVLIDPTPNLSNVSLQL